MQCVLIKGLVIYIQDEKVNKQIGSQFPQFPKKIVQESSVPWRNAFWSTLLTLSSSTIAVVGRKALFQGIQNSEQIAIDI